jgi:hypothetical protein
LKPDQHDLQSFAPKWRGHGLAHDDWPIAGQPQLMFHDPSRTADSMAQNQRRSALKTAARCWGSFSVRARNGWDAVSSSLLSGTMMI